MQRRVWTFLLFLLTALVCVSAIPQTDLPETSYDEADAPLNQAPMVLLKIPLVRPAGVSIVLPKKTVQAEWTQRVPADASLSTPASVRVDSHSLQDLLCTFLI